MDYKPHMLWSICHTGVNIFRENICHCQFLLAPHRFEHQMWVRLPSQHVEVFLSELGTAKSSCQSSFSKHTLCLFDAMEHEPLDQPFIDDQHEPFTFYKPGDFQFFNTMSLHTAHGGDSQQPIACRWIVASTFPALAFLSRPNPRLRWQLERPGDWRDL